MANLIADDDCISYLFTSTDGPQDKKHPLWMRALARLLAAFISEIPIDR